MGAAPFRKYNQQQDQDAEQTKLGNGEGIVQACIRKQEEKAENSSENDRRPGRQFIDTHFIQQRKQRQHDQRQRILTHAAPPEKGLLDVLEKENIGCIVFSPLAQGLLTDKYLKGIPEKSRVASASPFLTKNNLTDENLNKIRHLNELAVQRGQSLAQMAIAWLLKDKRVTSVLIGASSPEQLIDNIGSLNKISFSKEELEQIEIILK